MAFAAFEMLETLVGDEGNEYSIALAALRGRFQKKGKKGGKNGPARQKHPGKGPGATVSDSPSKGKKPRRKAKPAGTRKAPEAYTIKENTERCSHVLYVYQSYCAP